MFITGPAAAFFLGSKEILPPLTLSPALFLGPCLYAAVPFYPAVPLPTPHKGQVVTCQRPLKELVTLIFHAQNA